MMSLVSLCIQSLLPFADQLHQLPVRLHPRSSLEPVSDPRLWAVLVQIYDSLPPSLASYTLALADPHLPLLQSIPCTPSFSLITLLDLPSCPHLTDATILQLRYLNTLTAFDATRSNLSSYAIKTLASFLSARTGPWHLRVLSLRNCRYITNDAFPHLAKFPLLSVLDLRGTRCETHNSSLPFQPSSHHHLFHPAPLESALAALHSLHSQLYSSTNPYFLHINALQYKTPQKIPSVTPQDAFFVIPSDNSNIQIGNSHLLEERERELIYQRNKDAWYKRRDLVDSLSIRPRYSMDPDLTCRRVESSTKYIPSTSRISNSSWIGVSKIDPPKQKKACHSFPLSSNAPPPRPSPIPQYNRTSSASVQSFYHPLPKKSSLSCCTRSSHDDHLKLYRPAPLWSTLNECLSQVHVEEIATLERQKHIRATPPERQEDQIARVDMSSTKSVLVKRQLDEWSLAQTQIRRGGKEKSVDAPMMVGGTSLLSRNPFRRQGVVTISKPLKPISTVKVPILTPQVRKAALVCEEMQGLKRKRIEEEDANVTVKSEPSVNGPKVTTNSKGFNWEEWSKNAS